MSQARHQFLIASYAKDFPWLRQCLRSLEKFSDGFLPPVVAVDVQDAPEAGEVIEKANSGAIVKIWNGPGFGRAQDAMMNGDILCPGADYVWLLGSDCLAVEPFNLSAYCDAEGKPYMLWNTWKHLRKFGPETLFWRAGVEKALGWESNGEYMRRLPLAYPTRMLAPMREFIARRHNTPFNEYVWHNVNRLRNFSESNVMGEWAWRHARDDYHWVCLDKGETPWVGKWPTNPIVQHWSHGGIDRHRDQDGVTPREVIIRALGSL
jgi:hypothetical protein